MLCCRRGLWNPRVNVAPIYGVTSKIESLVVTILLLLWLWLICLQVLILSPKSGLGTGLGLCVFC